MERCGGYVATSMESHGEVWWKRGKSPWSPMEKCGGDVAASMESHGQLSSGYGF